MKRPANAKLPPLRARASSQGEAYATTLHGKASSTPEQQAWAIGAIRKPAADRERFDRVWGQVTALAGAYEMQA